MGNLISTYLGASGAVLGISIGAIGKAAAVVGVCGLLVGLLLGLASKLFHVKVDERELFIRDLLPGNNCGGCGFAGCDALAKAIAGGSAAVNACPVAGSEIHTKIGELMGKVAEGKAKRKVAYVKCSGTCDKAGIKYEYDGLADCNKASVVPGGGDKACSYGCLGYGSCVKACKFDAIHVVNGIAVVDRKKCVACGKCVEACPKNLIELVPEETSYRVQCNSKDKGKEVRAVCAVGCIGCMICVKQCEFDAVHVENNLAYIDPEKCTGCGKCAEKCPQKIIRNVR